MKGIGGKIVFGFLLGALIFVVGFFMSGALWSLFVIVVQALAVWGAFSKKMTRGKKLADLLIFSTIGAVIVYMLLRSFFPSGWRTIRDDVIYATTWMTSRGDAHFAKYKENQENFLNVLVDTIVSRQALAMKESLGVKKFDVDTALVSYDSIASRDSSQIAGVEKRRREIWRSAKKRATQRTQVGIGSVYVGPNETVPVQLDSVWREIKIASGLRGIQFLPSSKYFAYFLDNKKLYICGPEVGDTTSFGRHVPFSFLARTESGAAGVLTIITPSK